jgi:hypothetical protein
MSKSVSNFAGVFRFVDGEYSHTISEINLKYKTVRDMADAIKATCQVNNWDWQKIYLIGDAAGNNKKDVLSTSTAYKQFNDEGIATKKAKKPYIERRVALGNGRFYHKKHFIDPSCSGVIKDYERVTYKEGTSDIDKSNLDLTHYMDADSYGEWHDFPLKKASAVEISL